MNKSGLIEALSRKENLTEKMAIDVVNLVFKGDAFDFDEDGFYATLLDLDRRGAIKIESTDGTRIMLLDAPAKDIDSYERKVLNFLKDNLCEGSFFSAQPPRK